MVFSDAVVQVKLTLNSEQIYLEYSWHVKTIALSIYHENIKTSLQENQESGHNFSKNKLPSTNSQCCFLGNLPAIAYYESPVLKLGSFCPEVRSFLPQS